MTNFWRKTLEVPLTFKEASVMPRSVNRAGIDKIQFVYSIFLFDSGYILDEKA